MTGKGKNIFLHRLIYCFFLVSFLISALTLPGCKDKADYKADLEKNGTVYSEEDFLHQVKTGNREKAETYIRAGINVNAKDRDGSTALMIASERGDAEVVKLLLENGADPNAGDTSGYTALMFASYSGDLEIAKLLVKKGADVNARDKDGWTALMFASIEKKTEVADFLRKHGAGKRMK